MSGEQDTGLLNSLRSVGTSVRMAGLRLARPGRIRAPSHLAFALQDLRQAEPGIAEEMGQGRFLFASRLVETAPTENVFAVEPPSPEFARGLNGFAWLRHFHALPNRSGATAARNLVSAFMAAENGPQQHASDEPLVMARRVISWLSHGTLILTGAQPTFQARFVRELAANANALWLHAASGDPDFAGEAALAVLHFALAGHGQEKLIGQATSLARQALDRVILPDGGHVSRNPATLLDFAFDLLPMRQAFGAHDQRQPPEIAAHLATILTMIRHLSHRDSRLASFNGSGHVPSEHVSTLLNFASQIPESVITGMPSGYERLSSGESTIILDAGIAPPRSVRHHAGALAFEFSHRDRRLIVNCSTAPGLPPDLSTALRQTAAHSTLCVEGDDARPGKVTCERHGSNGWTMLSAAQDGYAVFGVQHQRRLALSEDGKVLVGEDSLVPAGRRARRSIGNALLRFHLAADIDAQLGSSGESAALSAGAAGVWLFTVEEARIRIEPSLVLSGARGMRPSKQLVIDMMPGSQSLRWRLTRMS
jgi:uncharacterized heparinase superfamily protein